MTALKIAYYFEHKEIIAGICIQEYEDRYQLAVSGRKEISLHKKRVFYLSSCTIDTGLSRDRQMAFLVSKTALQKDISRNISVHDLWQSLKKKGVLYEISFLAEKVFGLISDSDHEMALIRSLMDNGIYFRMKSFLFHANTPEQVEAIRLKKDINEKAQQQTDSFSKWLVRAVEKETLSADRDDHISCLKEYIVSGKDAACYSIIKKGLKSAKINNPKKCFALLVKTGLYDEDENLSLQRYRIPALWPEKVLQQTETLTNSACTDRFIDSSRKDLTGLDTFSIDDKSTLDIDDALSFEETGSSLILYIHIADAASTVKPGTPVDLEAKRRGRSLYLPDTKLPMIPESLSENTLSLKQGEKRAVITLEIALSEKGDILSYGAYPAVIKNDRKMTYDETDREIKSNSRFKKLYTIAGRLREQRQAKGAGGILLPELQLTVTSEKKIIPLKRERETESQILVSEFMILANYCASLIFKENHFPALYRKQSSAAEQTELLEDPSLFELFKMRKNFGRTDLGTDPGPHCGLGLESYTSITSPLRKYLDLITQRQLLNLLLEEDPEYDETALRDIAEASQPILTKAALAEQERKRYWLLKILQDKTGCRMDALVLEKKFRGYRVLLTEYFMDVKIKTLKNKVLTPGQAISVIIKNADPFEGLLQVSLADTLPE